MLAVGSKVRNTFPGIGHQHGQRGADRVQSAIAKRRMSSRNKPLVKLIRQGISSGYGNANHRTPRSPRFQAPSAGMAVEQQGEDGVLNHMGQFAEGAVKKTESPRRDVDVQEVQRQGQQTTREMGTETMGRKEENLCGPCNGYDPPEHGGGLYGLTFHMRSIPGPGRPGALPVSASTERGCRS